MARLPNRTLLVIGVAVTVLFSGTATAAGSIADKRRQAAQLASDLDQQAERIRALDIRFRRAEDDVGNAQSAMARAEARLAEVTRQQDGARLRLAHHAQDAYMLGGSLSLLSHLWRSHGDDAVSRRFYLDVVNGNEEDLLGEMRSLRQDLEARRADLAAARRAARSRADALDGDRAALARAFAAQSSSLAEVRGELAALVAAEQARRDADAARRAAVMRAASVAPRGSGSAQAPGSAPPGGVWACIRQLESGNNYSSPGGGAYQFLDSTWHALGQSGSAGDAPPAVQDAMAIKLQSEAGWQPWTTAPRCGRA